MCIYVYAIEDIHTHCTHTLHCTHTHLQTFIHTHTQIHEKKNSTFHEKILL